jgi:aminomethyltransferase
LNELVVSDLTQVADGRACYSLLVNEEGGILDDVIVYCLDSRKYLVVVNCANRAKDHQWLVAHRQGAVEVRDISTGRSILAIQGPKAAQVLENALETRVSGLGRFGLTPIRSLREQGWVARTGYTGSDGFEVFLPDAQALRLWQRLLEQGRQAGLQPVGLGARDTLRLEAGLRLYGSDMDETTSPYEADLGWTVAIHKPSFSGKEALVQQKANGVTRRLMGFELAHGPVPRNGFALLADGRQVGTVTSGTFSPTLNKPIGLGYVEVAFAKPGTRLQVLIRNHHHAATVVKLPFWRAETTVAQWPSGPVAQSILGYLLWFCKNAF